VAFFGVLADRSPNDIKLSRLDINIWCVPRFGGRYRFVCDVGLDLTPENGPLNGLTVALPFRSSELTDLGGLVADKEVAGLIFGEPVTLSAGFPEVVTARSESLRVVHLDTDDGGTKLLRNHSNSMFSMWQLRFSEPIQVGVRAYARFRVPIGSLGRFWVWRSSARSGRTAVVDVRVSDLREAAATGRAYDYARRLVRIERLNCLIIVPITFERLLCSPDPHYVRLLEAGVWKRYLPVVGRREKFLVHFWKKGPIAPDSEFRGLLGFAVARHVIRWDAGLAALGAALGVGLFVAGPQTIGASFGAQLLVVLGHALATWWGKVTAIAIVALPALWANVDKLVTAWEVVKQLRERRKQERLNR
jgi:hypothetical protein